MGSNITHEIDIVTVPASKIDSVDFENLSFGTVFTDHMFVCDFREGRWHKPKITPIYGSMIIKSYSRASYSQQKVMFRRA